MPLGATGWALVGSAVIGGVAANAAANKQSDSVDKSIDAQNAQNDKNAANQKPYLDAAKTVLPTLQKELQPGGQFNRSVTAQDINSNLAPDYAFTLEQGQKAVNNAQASQGRYGSGAGMKALDQFTTGLAGQYANTAFQNYQSNLSGQYNRLASLANLGQTGTSSLGGQSLAAAQGIGNTYTQQGNANAAGIVGAGNAISQPLSEYGNLSLAQKLAGNTSNGTNYGLSGGGGSEYGRLASVGQAPAGGYLQTGLANE
jgi:hypothetical protein